MYKALMYRNVHFVYMQHAEYTASNSSYVILFRK